jgi:hypothetical protein
LNLFSIEYGDEFGGGIVSGGSRSGIAGPNVIVGPVSGATGCIGPNVICTILVLHLHRGHHVADLNCVRAVRLSR